MDNHTRRIQVVGNRSFSVSLPKKWVLKNKLNMKKEVKIVENSDSSLSIFVGEHNQKDLFHIDINGDDYPTNLDSVLFSIYYLGFESVSINFKGKVTDNVWSRIRDILKIMSGTEVIYQDSKQIKIKFLLDKTKVDITQVLYRIVLILVSSLSYLNEKNINLNEIEKNELEIDRLYHLCIKIITISLNDASVLRSSNIQDNINIHSFFLISEKLEKIGDNICDLAKFALHHKIGKLQTIIELIKKEIEKCLSYILRGFNDQFEKNDEQFLKNINHELNRIKDKEFSEKVHSLIGRIIDIENELTKLSFYKKILKFEKKEESK